MNPVLAVILTVLAACLMVGALVVIGLYVQALHGLLTDFRQYVNRSGKADALLHITLVVAAIVFLAAVDLLLAFGIWAIWAAV